MCNVLSLLLTVETRNYYRINISQWSREYILILSTSLYYKTIKQVTYHYSYVSPLPIPKPKVLFVLLQHPTFACRYTLKCQLREVLTLINRLIKVHFELLHF